MPVEKSMALSTQLKLTGEVQNDFTLLNHQRILREILS